MDIARHRLHNERLIGKPFRAPEDVVRWLTAVQAQDYPGAKWGVGQRVKNCADADLDRAYSSGKILRTHIMRPTWHFVMPADIRWLLALTSPRVSALMRTYDRRLELDEDLYSRTNVAITSALEGGEHLTRTDLSHALALAGIIATGQRLNHIVMRAELEALICSGAMRGKRHTYALFDERVPEAKSMDRDEALAELTRRYFNSHGPALVQDFAWWSGLTVADARAGVEMARENLLQEVVDGKTYWLAPPSGPVTRLKDPTVHLLPNYDEFLIAYRDHSASLNPSFDLATPAVYDMLARHIVVVNGRVVGGWRSTSTKTGVVIETKLLAPLTEGQTAALHAAAERYAAFLGVPVTIRP